MTEPVTDPLRILCDRLGPLIDITRTIDRNSDDALHARRGGRISYVLDTNAVQMFFEPHKNPQFAETFFSAMWDQDPRGDEVINAQACLIAGEYLMSGMLPGQRRDAPRWYMTGEHHREVERQIAYLVTWGKEIADRMGSDAKFGEFVLDQIRERQALEALDPHGDRDIFLKLARAQRLPEPMIDALATLDDQQFAERATGIAVRELCRLLSQDWIGEPARQLVRYRNAAIASRYRQLDEHLKPSDEDWEAIRADSAVWRGIITEILQRQAGRTKSARALTADCDALALVNWANARPGHARERVVFVTGDRVLLEACRQRYVADQHQRFYFARPISHFAPLFNPTSAKSVVEREAAFERLREVLEGALVALNLSLLSERAPEWTHHARDAFALFVEQRPDSAVEAVRSFFPKARDEDWVATQNTALDRLVDDLRSVELLMLEAYPWLVKERLVVHRDRTLDNAASEGRPSLAAAITTLLETARAEGFRFSAEMMADAVADLLSRIDPEDTSERVSIQVRLEFSEEPRYRDFRQTVAWLKDLNGAQLQETLERLGHRPERIFALAALLAFSLEIWREAARYADLAAQVGDDIRLENEDQEIRAEVLADLHELLFLHATSLRFQLASFESETAQDSVSIWRGWREPARRELARCLRHHKRIGEWARALRALSERAALQLAYCELIVFGAPALLPPARLAVPDAMRAFTKTVADLALCENMRDRAEDRVRNLTGDDRDASAAILKAATRQFRSNIWGARAIALRLAELAPTLGAEIEAQLARLPVEANQNWPNMPRIALSYRLAATGQWQQLIDLSTDNLTLALDRLVIDGLKRLAPSDQTG